MSVDGKKTSQISSAKESFPPPRIANSENYLKWRNVLKRKGPLELFDYFICQAGQRPGTTLQPWKSRSITINIAGRPVVKIFPRKCNEENGLWLGYKDYNLHKAIKKTMPISAIPTGFALRNEGWCEGYVNSTNQIDLLLSIL